MSRSRAISAIRSMREANDEGNIQLASYFALIFLAEDQGAATGDHLRERREGWQNGQVDVPEGEH